MTKAAFTGSPSPEEFQKQLSDFVRQHFQATRGAAPDSVEKGTDGADNGEKAAQFEFKQKPREVKAYLDRFVIKQDDAKKVLSVALCDHYHHVRLALEGKESANYAKQNIILIGPTGVGKTFLIRNAADLIGVPFVKADATKFSETGYVGGDVEDMVRDLLRLANGDVTRAQYGIIYIDEIDKIAAASNLTGRDVSGRAATPSGTASPAARPGCGGAGASALPVGGRRGPRHAEAAGAASRSRRSLRQCPSARARRFHSRDRHEHRRWVGAQAWEHPSFRVRVRLVAATLPRS